MRSFKQELLVHHLTFKTPELINVFTRRHDDSRILQEVKLEFR